MTRFRELPETSIRQYARDRGIPYETLRYWLKRFDQIGVAPEVKGFFESPVGTVFLHSMMLSLHTCFTKTGAASIRDISRFLECTKLNQFVASSIGSQHALSKQIDEQIVAFGREETRRLAAQMPEKLICVAEDETFHPDKMCLVVMDPVSNYIILECHAEKRDSKTWTRLLEQALEGLNVKVVWQTSDEAKGLRHHAMVELQATHAPDLFHIQQELVKGTSRVLAAQSDKAAKEHRELMARSRPVAKGLRFETRPDLEAEQIQAGMKSAIAYCRCKRVKEARHSISDAYHPYDIFTGEQQTTEGVSSKLSWAFKIIETATAHLGEASQKRIGKAENLIDEISATINSFLAIISMLVRKATQSEILREELLSALIPGYYLLEVARKEKCDKRSQTIEKRARALLHPFEQRAGPFASLVDSDIAHLEDVARECAGLYQRSSSCVEGRNAHLARYHRGFHRISDLRLSALTVVHNFLIKRPDGTTPAQRFFQREHGDLFQWLVEHVDLPSRPRNRKKYATPIAA